MDNISETIEELNKTIKDLSDMSKAMEELFKDHIDYAGNNHDIDLRSRLTAPAIRGHAVINYLGYIKVDEIPGRPSLAEGLQKLSISLKRHVLSLDGKSRIEITDLFRINNEANRPPQAGINLLQPIK